MWLSYQLMTFSTETFDLESHFTLRAIYSMEQEGIPVLTELIDNRRKINSMICITEDDAQDSSIYKWPALHVPCVHEPTWKTLCSILQSIDKLDLVVAIKSYLDKKKGIQAGLFPVINETLRRLLSQICDNWLEFI